MKFSTVSTIPKEEHMTMFSGKECLAAMFIKNKMCMTEKSLTMRWD